MCVCVLGAGGRGGQVAAVGSEAEVLAVTRIPRDGRKKETVNT